MSTSDGGHDQQTPRSGPRATYPTERSPRNKRRWFYVLAVAVIAAGIGIAYIGYERFGDPDISGQVTGYELLSADRVAVQYTVNRADPSDAVACIVRARAKDGAEVGRREILIPAGTQTQVGARTEVSTSRAAVIGELFGCGTDVPSYLQPNA